MKTLLTKGILATSVILFLSLNGKSQAYLSDPKFGVDEESRKECASQLSMYKEHYDQRNYSMAKAPWQKVMQLCPASRQNPYIHGVNMLKVWIEEEKNPARKKELVDSLMMVYDMRIQHFNHRAKLLGLKGMDLASIDPDRFEEAYTYLKESVETKKHESESPVMYTYMALTKTMYDNGKLQADAVIETYSQLADMLDIQIKADPNDGRLAQIKSDIDDMFSSAGVADCNNLVQIFGPRVQANNDDAALIKKAYTLLKANRCETTDLYKTTIVGFFKSEPSSVLAYEISRIFGQQKDFDKQVEYIKQAIELEEDAERKSMFMVEYATTIFNDFNNSQQARSIALQAIEINPNIGHAYILIGNIYAAEKSCFSDDFQKKTVFWAAVDKYNKAKQVDPSLASDCDRLINAYTQYFPAQNDIFFQDLQAGDRYTVGCWINESTTVRSRPQ